MMLRSNPTEGDFLEVCLNATSEYRQQYEMLAGEEFDPARLARIYPNIPGPQWAIEEDGRTIAVGGFIEEDPGVYRDFLFSTPEAWAPGTWRGVTRLIRQEMDQMLRTCAHKLECVTLASRTKIIRWYKLLGLTLEGPLHEGDVGRDSVLIFSRVRNS